MNEARSEEQLVARWMQAYGQEVTARTPALPDHRQVWMAARWQSREVAQMQLNRLSMILDLVMQGVVLLLGSGVLVWYRMDIEVFGISINPTINKALAILVSLSGMSDATALPLLALPSYSLAALTMGGLLGILCVWNLKTWRLYETG